MAKKSSALPQSAGLKSMRSEDIMIRPWIERTGRRCSALPDATAGNDSLIDFEDIPRLTDEQLASMVRLRDVRPKVATPVKKYDNS